MLISYQEIFSNTWNAYTKNWKLIGHYILSLFTPILILKIIGIAALYFETYLPFSAVFLSLTTVILTLGFYLFTVWVNLAMIKNLNQILTGQPLAWRESMSLTRPLFWRAFLNYIVVGLIVFGGSLLLVIPGIIFAVWYMFSTYAIVLENQTGKVARLTSRSLVAGRWWKITLRTVLPNLVFVLAAAAISYFLTSLLGFLTNSVSLYNLISETVSAFFSTLVAPLSALVLLNIYNSAKNQTAEAK